MTASKEIVEVALASQQALTMQVEAMQVEATFKAAFNQQMFTENSDFQQQTNSDDLMMEKQVAGDHISELESQMLIDRKHSDEQAKECKIVSDINMSVLKSRLVEEEAASLLHKEQSSRLQEALDKVETNLSDALDQISLLESQAVKQKQKQEQDVVTDTVSTQKLLTLEKELKETKEFSEIEHVRHEEQIISLLTMAGLNDLNPDPIDEPYFEKLNQDAVEEQRLKILALKSCLFQFSSQLKKEDIEKLLNVGIILE
jgi:hypothetical protein